ncbi:hypothetical protein PsorP6_001197 [Peronosclerospora sorghi]|uniref:Uncharacterized protein n=1 Tax=Peronosclerospora sorghi TaxID=230839 RepID=A0ACC0WVI0_9STRA|nr:hypothetical protein PsorP6_001197 [Peronosclerospora sorghi]
MIDLVSKLRVIERMKPGDPACIQSRCHSMCESLMEEFELNERFLNPNFKIELIQHNTKVLLLTNNFLDFVMKSSLLQFFMEVLDSRKGERLESTGTLSSLSLKSWVLVSMSFL